jgi:hypothetical protein
LPPGRARGLEGGSTPALTAEWWAGQSGTTQAIVGLLWLLAVSVFAYVLQAFTKPVVQFYEGYWPAWLGWLARWFRAGQYRSYRRMQRIEDPANGYSTQAREQARFFRYSRFPVRVDERLRPTRLGNALTAAEEYSTEMYRADAVLWWPRLTPLLPESFRSQVDAALTPMLALVNLSAILGLLAVVGGPVFAWLSRGWLWFATILTAELFLAWLCYLAAVTQAVEYGKVVRVAFDLYRHEILKQMHVAVPDNLALETALWTSLTEWIYEYRPPWETQWPPDPAQLPQPLFPYDHAKAATEAKPEEATVTVKVQAKNT